MCCAGVHSSGLQAEARGGASSNCRDLSSATGVASLSVSRERSDVAPLAQVRGQRHLEPVMSQSPADALDCCSIIVAGPQAPVSRREMRDVRVVQVEGLCIGAALGVDIQPARNAGKNALASRTAGHQGQNVRFVAWKGRRQPASTPFAAVDHDQKLPLPGREDISHAQTGQFRAAQPTRTCKRDQGVPADRNVSVVKCPGTA